MTREVADRKRLGAYYTPAPVAEYLVSWAVRSDRDVVLEPAAGAGAFVGALNRAQPRPASVIAVEIDPSVASVLEISHPEAHVVISDFLELGHDQIPTVDAVIGNPPFIRFQRMSAGERERGRRLARSADVQLPGTASSWAHFVLHASSFLRERGRMALVLPRELVQTHYGRAVAEFLGRRFRSLTIVGFDELVFTDALVDAMLVLADHDGPPGLHRVQVSSPDALSALMHNGRKPRRLDSRGLPPGVQPVYGDLLASARYAPLGSLARIDIGVVTGASDYFVLDDSNRQRLGIELPYVSPLIRGSRDVRGLTVQPSEVDWLFSTEDIGTDAVRDYIALGEELGVDKGYKTSRRATWHSVPLPTARPDLVMPAMSNRAPRLVVNPSGAMATNLMYHVELKDRRIGASWLAAASMSSVFALSAEIEGRGYAGGVLKLEPSEAERVLVPTPDQRGRRVLARAVSRLDRLVRLKRWDDARLAVDDMLELDTESIAPLLAILRERRHARGAT